MRGNACSKCQGAMEAGAILISNMSTMGTVQWVLGPVRKHWFSGLKMGGKPVDLTAHRCGRCGFVELYAAE